MGVKNGLIRHIAFMLLALFLSNTAQAIEYTCMIKNVSSMSDTGYFVKHGWAANYMNREFSVDRESGKVLNTTALKQRLSNFNQTHQPIIINKDRENIPFRVITHYEDTGKFALLEIKDHVQYKGSEAKPFYYHTDVGMILSGTCRVAG